MVKLQKSGMQEEKGRFSSVPRWGNLHCALHTDLCLHHHAAPTHLVQLRLLPQEQKCGIQFSSVQQGAAAQTRQTAAALDHCGRRRQSAAPSAVTAAFNKRPQ